MVDDAQLLLEFTQAGSGSAFRELVERHVNMVYSAALPRVGYQAHVAEEVAQQVFSDLARKAPSLLRHSSLVGWLFTSVRFAASDAVRSEARRRRRERGAAEMNDTPSAEAPEWERVRPFLQEVLDELRPEHREAVLLRYFEKRPFAEIAAVLKLTEAAAQKRVGRSLDTLRERLLKRGVTSSVAALSAALADQAFAAPAGLGAKVAAAALAPTAAGGAAATAFNLIKLMTMTKYALGAGALAVAIGIGAGSYHLVGAIRTEKLAAAAALDNSSLTQSLRTLESRGTKASPGAPAGASPAAVPAKIAAPLDARKVFARNPELARKALHLEARQHFAGLYAELGLTIDQIDRVEDLLVETKYRKEYSDPPMSQAERAAMEDRMMAAAAGIVGPDAVQKFDDYDSLHNYREMVQNVAAQAYSSDTPLTADQGRQLLALLVDNAEKSPEDPAHPGPLSTIDWESVFAQTQGRFAPAQLDALRGIAIDAQFNRQFAELVASQPSP